MQNTYAYLTGCLEARNGNEGTTQHNRKMKERRGKRGIGIQEAMMEE